MGIEKLGVSKWAVFLGLFGGTLAASGASGRVDALAQVTPVQSAKMLEASLPAYTEKTVRLASGEALTLSADGSSLTLTASKSHAQSRSFALVPRRKGASLTALPSGRVLIWGGLDEHGKLVRDGAWFNTELKTMEVAHNLAPAPRAGHTATVMTDGRVLFAGGLPSTLPSELWDEKSDRALALSDVTRIDRANARAILQEDGAVRLIGGVDEAGRRAGQELVFDTVSGRFQDRPVQLHQWPKGKADIAATLPVQGASNVSIDPLLAIRFNQQARVTDLSAANFSLVGPGGPVPVSVVAAEEGRLAFVRGKQTLFPDSKYTLMMNGVHADASGERLPLSVVDFRTSAIGNDGRPAARPSAVSEDNAQAQRILAGDSAETGCKAEAAYFSPCRSNGRLLDAVWYPGKDNADNRWRIPGNGLSVEKSPNIARIASVYHVTMVRGRILRIDQKPVANVEVSIGGEVTKTDRHGWFTLVDVPSGYRELYVDGTTANSRGEEYGQFVVGVNLKAGQLNELPYLMHLPKISRRDKVKIPSPLAQDMVIGHPDIPGLELHIPKGTIIYDRKGRLVTELAIVPMPVNRATFPVMENHPMAFTVEPGAAQVRGLEPSAANGIRVYYPNYDRYPAGTEANFWIYEPQQGWRVYGKGTASPDGKHFVPEQGVALHQTMGGMYSVPGTNRPSEPSLAADNTGACGCNGDAAVEGDPIDLRTGEYTYSEKDVTIHDIVPITVARSYRPHDMNRREFGIGTSWNWGYTLSRPDTSSYDVIDLVLPNGSSVQFGRISGSGNQGEWRQAGSNTEFAGALLKTVYDSDPTQPWGRAYRLTLRDGSRMQFSSYNDIRVRWIEDRHGNRTSLVYDAGLVVKVISPSGRSISIDYDGNSRISTIADSAGREWVYQYNSDGLLSDVTYPDSTTKHYSYKTVKQGGALSLHRVEAVTDQRGIRILLNEFEVVSGAVTGRVIKQTQADGGEITIDYAHVDGATTGTLVTKPDGSKRRFIFNALSAYPTSITEGYGTSKARTTNFERNSNGLLTAITDPLARRTEYAYNLDGQPISVKELAGTSMEREVSMSYSVDGDISVITDPLGRQKHFGYTNRCLTSVVDQLQRETRLICNVAGQPTKITDPIGRSMDLSYDGYELVSVTDTLGRTVRYRYDAFGRPISNEDSEGNLVRFEYDVMGRLSKKIDGRANATSFAYDNNGNVVAVLLPNGNGATYEYDVNNHLISRTDALGQEETWTYGASDRVETYTDRKGQLTSYSYDILGQLEATSYDDGSSVTATFDAVGRLTSLADSMAASSITWQYDDFDRVLSTTGPPESITYGYDTIGRRTSMAVAGQPTQTYEYDSADRLTKILRGTEVVSYAYDQADRISEVILPNGVRAGHAYNDANQITGLAWRKPDNTLLGDLGYGYDVTGKIASQTGSFASQLLPDASGGVSQYDDNNRQTSKNSQPIAYDANGNVTSDGVRTYVWDVRDQLAEIREGSSVIASFTYDALGRRISKTEGGSSVSYLYDAQDVVQETRAGVTNPIFTGLGVDQRYARSEQSGRVYYLVDALGSTRALTDGQGGVVQRYDYSPYGETSQTSSSFTNPYKFTGREQDLTGLYHYRARYYSPEAGRFISEDSFKFASGDANFYAYALGNPVSYTDPSGTFCLARFDPNCLGRDRACSIAVRLV
ncbi:RHS repeat-associated core domain-containing protein [Pseudoxanthomonas sp. UC19_8]|uniref:RHS repeat-associated core domain-containing protein n=1 Tax=Pseudoxanthomonas sp. UC19_8 TaxID=3350175 RepID=UPI0036D34D25